MDAGANVVFVWSPEGAFLGNFGKPGEGPGELSLKNGVGAVACTDVVILIYDESANKLHLWDRETRTFIKSLAPPAGIGRLRAFGFLGDRLVALNTRPEAISIVAIHPDFDRFEVLQSMPDERYVRKTGGFEWRPFANRLIVDFDREYLYYGKANENWIRKIDAHGRFLGEWLMPMPPHDLDEDEKDWMYRRFKNWAGERDRVFFPDEHHLITLITPMQKGRYLMASRFFWSTGTLDGVVIDTETGKKVGIMKHSFGVDLGYFGIFQDRVVVVDTDALGDYRVGMRHIVIGPESGTASSETPN